MFPSAPASPARGPSLFIKLREELMSRSDTFDSECDPAEIESGSRSLPWISAPVLQTTTCEALLDSRKLLCENSSIVATLPFQKLGEVYNKISQPVKLDGVNSFQCASQQKCSLEDLDVTSINVLQGDLLSEVLSSANALKVLDEEEIKILSPVESVAKNIPQNVPIPPKRTFLPQLPQNPPTPENPHTSEVSVEVHMSDSNEVPVKSNNELVENIPPWNVETDDSFKDVIDAINRLCDTISSASCKNNYTEEFCGKYTYHNEILEPVDDSNYHDQNLVESLKEVTTSLGYSQICDSSLKTSMSSDLQTPPIACTSPDIIQTPPIACTSPDIIQTPPITSTSPDIIHTPPISCISPDIIQTPPDSVQMPIDLIQTSPVNSDTNNSLTCEAKEEFYSCEDIPNATDMDLITNTPAFGCERSFTIEDSSVADSSSPAVIEDDSSTNQTDLLQFSMCSSSWNNEEGAMCTSIDDQSPKSEEIPPPGHVAAMRMKFETFTSISPTAARMLKRPDDDYI